MWLRSLSYNDRDRIDGSYSSQPQGLRAISFPSIRRAKQFARVDGASEARHFEQSTQKQRRHGDRMPGRLCITATICGRSDMHSQDAHLQAKGASPRRSADRPKFKEGVRSAKTISFLGFITEKIPSLLSVAEAKYIISERGKVRNCRFIAMKKLRPWRANTSNRSTAEFVVRLLMPSWPLGHVEFRNECDCT